jgi:hypothetical protein
LLGAASSLAACGGTPEVVTTTDADSGESDAPPADFLGEGCDPYGVACPSGQKCVPIAIEPYGMVFEAEHRCVQISSEPKQFDEECYSWGLRPDSYDNCDDGMICWGAKDQVDTTVGAPPPGNAELDSSPKTPHTPKHGDELGLCRAMCTGSAETPDCGSEWNWCVSSNGVDLCVSTCNPLDPKCDHMMACRWDETRDTFNCLHHTVNLRQLGADCSDCGICCEPTAHCDPAADVPGCEGEMCCNAWCATDGSKTCEFEGQTCVKFWPEGAAPPGQEILGQCTVESPGETTGP